MDGAQGQRHPLSSALKKDFSSSRRCHVHSSGNCHQSISEARSISPASTAEGPRWNFPEQLLATLAQRSYCDVEEKQNIEGALFVCVSNHSSLHITRSRIVCLLEGFTQVDVFDCKRWHCDFSIHSGCFQQCMRSNFDGIAA